MLYTYYLSYCIDTGVSIDLIKNVLVSAEEVTKDEAEQLVKNTLKYDECLYTFDFIPIAADEPRLLF